MAYTHRRLQIDITPEVHGKLDFIADAKGMRSRSVLIRIILEEYIKGYEKQNGIADPEQRIAKDIARSTRKARRAS
jgi:metal-responsive CopG/Arc/MetJ family transcriptional regulator